MRHVSLTDELIESICEFVKTGSSFKNAYLLAGVNSHTGQYWRSKALEDLKENKTSTESIYIKLSEKMDNAKQTYIRSLVDCVTAAGRDPKHWQAAMTMLERIDPETYSRFKQIKEYADLDIDPVKNTPVEIIGKILIAVTKGKISMSEGKEMSEIIGNLTAVEDRTETKKMLAEALGFKKEYLSSNN